MHNNKYTAIIQGVFKRFKMNSISKDYLHFQTMGQGPFVLVLRIGILLQGTWHVPNLSENKDVHSDMEASSE